MYLCVFFFTFINIFTVVILDEWNYAMRMDWIIWNIADPHTTNKKSANNHGPTGY